ncbi:hypothetical protein PZB74_13445 [Porifericola rhodea]|nr:hypothetical protein [Porifericola rhodea]WKN29969.1 hypothetical protein PZB74_13445 [Porifericola rhodea]
MQNNSIHELKRFIADLAHIRDTYEMDIANAKRAIEVVKSMRLEYSTRI